MVGAAALVGVGLLPGTVGRARAAGGNLPRVVSAHPVAWTPNVLDGQVQAIAEVGSRVVIGGRFSAVQAATGGAPVGRSNLFSFDPRTGAIDPGFAPALDGEVTSLVASPDGASVFVGGAFRGGLVKLSLGTGAPVAGFSAPTDSAVLDLALKGTNLYVAGRFSHVRGVARGHLAAVDVTSGAVSPRVAVAFTQPFDTNGPEQVRKIDVTNDGSRLVAIGNFRQAGGKLHPQVAVVDLTASPVAVTSWISPRYLEPCNAPFGSYPTDVAFSQDGTWFAVTSFGGYRPVGLCDSVVRWPTSPPLGIAEPAWINRTGGDSLFSVAVTTAAVYVGGHQRWVSNPLALQPFGDSAGPGAVPREGLAAIDPATGKPLPWNPGKDRGLGVFALVVTPRGLWVGSDTDRIARYVHHAKLALFPPG